ncbi:MAG: hypothetical protein ABI366_02655 [Ginsengibacter sp.]
MKSISFWANNHKVAARISIILIYFLLNVIGIFLGDILFSMNVFLSPVFYIIAILIGLLGLFFYPSSGLKPRRKNYYYQQKSSDFLLILSTFLFIIYTGNSVYNSDFKVADKVKAGTTIYLNSNVFSLAVNKKAVSVKKATGKKWRNIIREIRKKYKSSTQGQKTLYIIIAVLVAVLLVYVLAGLSCSIACSGSEAIAYIILFLGLGGIIFGLVKIIQRINRGKPKKETLKTVQ